MTGSVNRWQHTTVRGQPASITLLALGALARLGAPLALADRTPARAIRPAISTMC